jgi:hypothetical protein
MKAIPAIALCAAAISSLAIGALGCSGSHEVVTIPPHTTLAVSLSTTTRSDRITPGVKLRGKLERPIMLADETLVEAGRPVTIEVVASSAAEGDAPARISLIVDRIGLPSGRTMVETEVLEIVGRPKGMSDADSTSSDLLVGGGSSVSSAIGAVVGSAIAVPTKGDTIVLPAGQRLFFSTSRALEVPRPSRET